MTTNNEVIKRLNEKFYSVMKRKFIKHREYQQLQHMESVKSEELKAANDETEQLKQLVYELKDQILLAQKQLFKLELARLSTEKQIESYKQFLEDYRNGFEELFQREKEVADAYYRALREKKEAELKKEKEKQKQIAEANEKQLQEAISIEAECEAIEMECTVLNKRNSAIMLRLRRKLVETEDMRKALSKKEQ